MGQNTGIEVQVISWKVDGKQEVSIHFRDIDQMVTINAEVAKNLAFSLVECADYIEPPFNGEDPTEELMDSDSFFGPYDEEIPINDFDDDDEESF